MRAARMKHALQATLVVSLGGVTFSGVLTYRELFRSALACPSPGAAGTILGYPACVYGFFMYCILAIIAGFGLTGARNGVTASAIDLIAGNEPRTTGTVTHK